MLDALDETMQHMKGTEKAAEMTLDTRSTRTVRLGKGGDAGGSEGPPEGGS